MNQNVTAVIGGQFGSEGKGAVVQKIWDQYKYHVRVGAANAGHTGWILGEKVVSQQLPMAAWAYKTYKNIPPSLSPLASRFTRPICIVGPGAIISLDILMREIEESCIPPDALYIDHRAHVIQQEQIDDEAATDLAARIGSTSTIAREGIGTATADRVMRAARCTLAAEVEELNRYIADTVQVLDTDPGPHDRVMLEGTQGTGLSLTTGFFPYTTSRNTTAAGLCADAGVAPTRLEKVIGVFRTYPIRVAGNSGPFHYGSEEVQFEDIGVEQEVTTVTKLRRRIATWSDHQLRDAVRLNGITECWLTFFNYVHRQAEGHDSLRSLDQDGLIHLSEWEKKFDRAGVPLRGVGTSPQDWIMLDDPVDHLL